MLFFSFSHLQCPPFAIWNPGHDVWEAAEMARPMAHVRLHASAHGASRRVSEAPTRLRAKVESGHPDALRRRKQAEARRAEQRKDGVDAERNTCWWESGDETHVMEVKGLEELARVLRGAAEKADRESKLVVVKYFAPWCNGCRTLFPKVLQLAEKNPQVTFVKMNVGEDENLAESLGVTRLPYFQFYNGGEGIVTHFNASLMPDKLRRLRAAVEYYQSPDSCLLEMVGLPPALEEAVRGSE